MILMQFYALYNLRSCFPKTNIRVISSKPSQSSKGPFHRRYRTKMCMHYLLSYIKDDCPTYHTEKIYSFNFNSPNFENLRVTQLLLNYWHMTN
jgi:hypothetical protein